MKTTLKVNETLKSRIDSLNLERENLLYEQELKIQNIREKYIDLLAVVELKIRAAEDMKLDAHRIHSFIK